jgi:hypothetical protein
MDERNGEEEGEDTLTSFMKTKQEEEEEEKKKRRVKHSPHSTKVAS